MYSKLTEIGLGVLLYMCVQKWLKKPLFMFH